MRALCHTSPATGSADAASIVEPDLIATEMLLFPSKSSRKKMIAI